MKDYKSGPWTPENNDQHLDSVHLCSCPYCGAKPMEWCITAGGYIAQQEHSGRRKALQKRSQGDGPPAMYTVVPPSKGRVVTIEMIIPTHMDDNTREVIKDAVDRLATSEGKYAAVVSDQCIEQTMDEAAEILRLRSMVL